MMTSFYAISATKQGNTISGVPQRMSDPFRELISYYVKNELDEKSVDLLRRFGGEPSDAKRNSRSGLLDNDYRTVVPGSGVGELLTVSSSWPFPRILTDRLAACQVTCNTGYLPEIGRAWLAVDGWLAIWKPNDTSGNSIMILDRVQQWGRSILCLDIVAPKPGVFREGLLSYILCIGTTDDVHIVGVVLPNNGSGDPGEQDCNLTDVLMSCSTDGVAIQDVVCSSSNGRIFLAGVDGFIYEVEYNAVDTWWTPKLRLVNLTSTWFPLSSVSNMFGISHVDPLKQLCLDRERRILYARSESSTISAYSLGQEPMLGFYHIGYVNLSDAKKAAERLFGEAVATATHFQRIADIAPVDTSDSASIHLVAVTDSGARIYFSAPTETSPDFYIRHIRLPPGYTPSVTNRPSTVYAMSSLPGFSLVFTAVETRATPASPGLLSRPAAVDQTVAWVFASGAKSSILNPPIMPGTDFNPRCAGEFVMSHTLFLGRVLNVSSLGAKNETLPMCVRRNKLLAITDGVIHVIETVSLVDQFRCLVSVAANTPHERSASTAGRDLNNLVSLLGPVRVCTLSLASLTFDPSRIQCDPQLVLACLNKYGVQTLPAPNNNATPGRTPASHHQQPYWMQSSLIGSSPAPQSPLPGNTQGNDNSNNANSPQHTWKSATPRSDGIALCSAMLLSPIWHNTIITRVHPKTDAKQQFVETVFESRLPASFLTSAARALHSVIEIVSRFIPASANQPLVRGASHGISPLVLEGDELRRWIHVVDRIVQLISLLSIIAEHDIDALLTRGCDSNEAQAVFTSLNFNQWLAASMEDDNTVTSALIASLFRLYDLAGSDTGPLSTRLEAACPSLYTRLERVYAKALRLLVAADKASIDRRPELLQQAVNLLREVAPHLNLGPVCQHLVRLGCYVGVLDICLEAARVLDPHSLALIHLRSCRPINDSAGHAALEVRHQCYAPIAQMLNVLLVESGGPGGQLDAVLKMVGRITDDAVFHFFVYDWLLDKSMSDRLIGAHQADAPVFPFADEYLRMCLAIATNVDSALTTDVTAPLLPGGLNAEALSELLVNVYIKQGRNSDAAELLARMAEDDISSSSLADRISRLSRAILCLRSIGGMDDQSAQSQLFLGELSDKLEAAHHQEKLAERVATAAKAADASALLRKHADVALSQLNCRLLPIQQMYDIASTSELRIPDSCLPLLRFANITDISVIKEVWKGVVDTLLSKYGRLGGSAQARSSMAEDFAAIAKQHISSDIFFPLDFIMLQLEFAAVEMSFGSGWVPRIFIDMLNISPAVLLPVYRHAVTDRMQFWESVGHPLHLVESALYIVQAAIGALSAGRGMSASERSRLRDLGDQFLDECRVEVQQSLTLVGHDDADGTATLLNKINEMKSALHVDAPSALAVAAASPYPAISSPSPLLATGTRTPRFGAR